MERKSLTRRSQDPWWCQTRRSVRRRVDANRLWLKRSEQLEVQDALYAKEACGCELDRLPVRMTRLENWNYNFKSLGNRFQPELSLPWDDWTGARISQVSSVDVWIENSFIKAPKIIGRQWIILTLAIDNSEEASVLRLTRHEKLMICLVAQRKNREHFIEKRYEGGAWEKTLRQGDHRFFVCKLFECALDKLSIAEFRAKSVNIKLSWPNFWPLLLVRNFHENSYF